MKIIGEGSVTRAEKKERSKCRKWILRVQTDRVPLYHRSSGTYSQARAELDKWIAALETPASDMTFAEYAEIWRMRRVRGGELEANTVDKERQQIALLNREFGGILLHEIDRPRAQDGLLNIKNGNNPSVKVLSGTYMNQAHARMKAIMESTVDDDLIAKNPLRKVKAPKLDTSEKQALPREKLARFISTLDALPLDSHTVGVRLIVLDGLRRSEAACTP